MTKLSAVLLLVWTATAALAQTVPRETIEPYLWQAEMAPSTVGEVNPFRRFSSDRIDAMKRFYTEVLGIAQLPQAGSGGGLQMLRYPIGGSEVKLFPSMPDAPSTAGVSDVAGLRLLTYFFADEAALTNRFEAFGAPSPAFKTRADGRRAALVRDPDGEWVELVIVPNATPEDLARVEVGIGASDLAASRAFYRDVLGLEESDPVHDERVGADKYTYRHRDATIHVWPVGANAPKDGETGGIQYIVWNVEAVSEVAARLNANITRPLAAPTAMRSFWLADPDGVANYFAQFSGQDNSPPRTSE